ncbi:MAG TPA: HD domain-containing protein [Methanoregulaceae archaeon]|nr:HD domain-containing protein [Methanoregulaceae archaeon]HQJ87607.1 HD domain-containing protein [Methanoregulaceae archaeon]
MATPTPGLVEAVRASPLLGGTDQVHAEQVTRLALQLFDALVPLHRLGMPERSLLEAAGLLHDIGWRFGRKGHHRRSCELIRDDRTLPLGPEERVIVALVARFHRRGLPDPGRHPLYATLDPSARMTVCWLGGILRLADGLDRSHLQEVGEVRCELLPETIRIRCCTRVPVEEDRSASFPKADLLEATSRRRCELTWERA